MIDPTILPKISELRAQSQNYLDVYLTEGNVNMFLFSLTTNIEVSNFLKWLILAHYSNEYRINQFLFINDEGDQLNFSIVSLNFRKLNNDIYVSHIVNLPHTMDLIRIKSRFELVEDDDEDVDISDIHYRHTII